MPRHPRLFLPGAIYHVYCRVARGEFVFDDEFESMEFVETVRRIRDLDGWSILAWCLMGNHYHLVVKTGFVELWRSMARLQARVARGFNRRRGFFGRLWQSRYRARVIDTDEHYRQVLAYVHLNPVAAGIVDDPAAYRFSGHREILGLCRPHVIDRGAALRGFGGDGVAARADDYLRWMRSVAEARTHELGVSELPWWEQANHADEIADAGRHPCATLYDGRVLTEERAEIELAEFASHFENASGRAIEDLASRGRSPGVIRGRVEFVALALPRYGFRGCDVAKLLGKHGNSVTLWLSKGLRLERSDPDFRRRLDDLDAAISRRV
jgi:REP element-mobilizing transposase RayT